MSEYRLSAYADLFASFFLVAVILELQKQRGVSNPDAFVVPKYDRLYSRVLLALAETEGLS